MDRPRMGIRMERTRGVDPLGGRGGHGTLDREHGLMGVGVGDRGDEHEGGDEVVGDHGHGAAQPVAEAALPSRFGKLERSEHRTATEMVGRNS